MALPASGKSEVRKYLAGLSPERCRDEFHIGPTVQLDDFPYVHLMRRIDDELAAAGGGRLFFQSPEKPFQNPYSLWRRQTICVRDRVRRTRNQIAESNRQANSFRKESHADIERTRDLFKKSE